MGTSGDLPFLSPCAFHAGTKVETLQILTKRLREIRASQREIHHRLQVSELVAGVVPHARNFARVNRPRLEQPSQAVGQLNFTRAILRRRFECRKNVGRQNIAADDCKV